MRVQRLGLVVVLGVLVSACASETPLAPAAAVPLDLTAPASLTLDAAIGQGSAAGHATVTARVLNGVGTKLAGIPVSFTTDVGALSIGTTTTGADGTATTVITAASTATLTAIAGRVTTKTIIPSQPLVAVIPPSVPPPVTPPVVITPPPPPPPPLPVFTVTLTPSASTVVVGAALTFTATVAALQPAETVIAYQWDLDGSGSAEFTSTTNTHLSAVYAAHGLVTAKVVVLTNLNRSVSATVPIVVTN